MAKKVVRVRSRPSEEQELLEFPPPTSGESSNKIKFEDYGHKPHRWLSNLFKCEITDSKGMVWKSAEHAYQGFRTPDQDYLKCIRAVSHPQIARCYGNTAPARGGWDEIKVKLMRNILLAKFTQHEDLKAKLLATEDKALIYRYAHPFWGIDFIGKGMNMLGRILMETRERLGTR